MIWHSETLRVVGRVLLAICLLWVIAAQGQMGASWRIGIDTGVQPPPVRSGLFALSRNSIFLSMGVASLGLFPVLPAGVTLSILVPGVALIQVQVRPEDSRPVFSGARLLILLAPSGC